MSSDCAAGSPDFTTALSLDDRGRLHLKKKTKHMYTMEYYAAIKNDESVSFAGTWMNLETIILNKLTQEQKIKH